MNRGFAYCLKKKSPYLVTAIHAGHQVREELLPLMRISEKARLFEEDAATDLIIGECSNIIWSLDSRAEYDLNRSPGLALPLTAENFWGTEVYHKTPDPAINQRSLEKYHAFYRFIEHYLENALQQFGFCVVYDIHSYNLSRQIACGISQPPTFNLGTAGINREKYRPQIDAWLNELSRITIPGIETTVAENLVFSGNGEFCRRLSALDNRILVLPTEIAKIYMNEHTGDLYSDKIKNISRQLAKIVKENEGMR